MSKFVEGYVLNNRYRLDRRIAVGGMGEVWAVHDLALARTVACKMLKEELTGNPEFLERLRLEARNNAALSHPNVAQVYDYGEDGGTGYLVQELISGDPLNEILSKEPVLPLPKLLPIIYQTARGLYAAHLAGVVHRDVKPANILVDRATLRVKITDFGVSLGVNQVSMTATGMVMGTAQYLAPEQAIGKPATSASDIYSLGIILYESVVGRRPFTGTSAVEIAVAHVNKEVPELPSSVDKELAALILRMLDKDPLERPRTANTVARTADNVLHRVSGHRVADLVPGV